MLSFPKAIKKAFRDYAVFSGRSRRSEFWWFALFNTVVTMGLQFAFFTISVITGLVWVKFLVYLYSLATLIPSFAVAVRRLHDTGRSGGWPVGTSNDTYSPFGRMEWLYLGSSDSLSLRSDLLSSQHHHLGVLRQRFEYIQQQVWAFAQIYRLISTKVNQHLIISEERYIVKCGLLFFSKKWYILGRN